MRHKLNPFVITIMLLMHMLGVHAWVANSQPAAAAADTAGIAFKLDYNPASGVYAVYLQPNANASAPGLTLSAQVTVKVPHAVGASKFTPSAITSYVAGTAWSISSRVNGPQEAMNADYLSFELSFPGGNYSAFDWQTDQAIKVFGFKNSAACIGAVGLIRGDDAFIPKPPQTQNSVGSNPGNQISVLVLGADNAYIGNYGAFALDCAGVEVTPTATSVPPTATSTTVPATATATSVPPTATSTSVPATVPATATATSVPPTAASTTVPATATATSVPPTATSTTVPATATATSVPPTATSTTAPATATATSVPPTATSTTVPATATATSVPPTATSTDMPTPVTATNTPQSVISVPTTFVAVTATPVATAPAEESTSRGASIKQKVFIGLLFNKSKQVKVFMDFYERRQIA